MAMSISARILAAKAAREAADQMYAKQEPVQYEPFGEEYELVKELVVEGYNINAALAVHNMRITLVEHRALQVVVNERDQYTIAR